MKIKKILLGLSPIIVATTGISTTLTSCGNSQLPKVSNHYKVNALLNILVQNPLTGPYYVTSGYGDVEVHHFNNSPVGYINVDDYVSILMQFEEIFGEEGSNFTSATKDYKTIITNTTNQATCTIDYTKQTLTFSDYDAFLCMEKEYAFNPLAVGAGGGEKYFIRAKDGTVLHNNKYVSGGQYVIDISKYNIPLYYYENKGYVPYDLYRNILNSNPLTYMFYNGVNFYQIDTANNQTTINLYKQVRDEATILTPEYMEYCYNLLALTLDTRFGLYERPSRANPGTTVKYFPNGAYEALAPYKEGLTSLKPDLANDYMCQFFADQADDGGHAGYSGLDILCTRPHQRTRGPEASNTFDAQDKVNTARTVYYAEHDDYPIDPQDYWLKGSGTTVYDNFLEVYRDASGNNPILYITFDAFNAVSDYNTSEKEMIEKKVDYNNVTVSNYAKDTIRMTMAADKVIRQNPDIKNVVIDLSCNGGGTVYTEHFLASWLCGGVTETIWNPHTKSYAQYTIHADVNGDDEFDENDYLPADVKVFCITSEMSFSCGNMLPCNLVDASNGKAASTTRNTTNTKFIGCPSGGGACFVDGNMHVGLGNVFRSSSNYHMLKNSSTQSNPISVESGCQPKNWWIDVPCTWEECMGYVDRIAINEKIRAL